MRQRERHGRRICAHVPRGLKTFFLFVAPLLPRLWGRAMENGQRTKDRHRINRSGSTTAMYAPFYSGTRLYKWPGSVLYAVSARARAGDENQFE